MGAQLLSFNSRRGWSARGGPRPQFTSVPPAPKLFTATRRGAAQHRRLGRETQQSASFLFSATGGFSSAARAFGGAKPVAERWRTKALRGGLGKKGPRPASKSETEQEPQQWTYGDSSLDAERERLGRRFFWQTIFFSPPPWLRTPISISPGSNAQKSSTRSSPWWGKGDGRGRMSMATASSPTC